jgi:alpha-glucosidase
MFRRAILLLAAAAACRADGMYSLSSVVNISCAGSMCDVWAAVAGPFARGASSPVPLRLGFYAPQIVRWWLAIDGNFSDTGAASDVIVGGASPVTVVLQDAGTYYSLTQASPAPGTPVVEVQLLKAPPLLTILVDGQAVAHEDAPLAWNDTSSWQTMQRDAAPTPPGLTTEWFFGVGMQHGSFSHRDTAVAIGVDYNWDEGGHPNAVPWYVSSAGYGVLRNTWAPGLYNFSSPVVTAHNESNRLDAFILLAGVSSGSAKTLLGLYTGLTGNPFLPPIYGLFLGDSDCYHNDRHGNSTQVAIAVAQEYNANDMPHGWMLVNDGYGCGYGEGPAVFPSNLTDLTYVVAQLHEQGMYTGLWTSTGMPNIQEEVGVAGTRVCKTDVGWIGSGYKFAFDGVSLCAGGIEQYSNPPARRFVWTVEGWAGTHRLAVMWTGDNSGSMDYVRWQLPSFVGAGFSAQAHVSGDVDGIFGGR